jgi:archaellum component FlaG (FlaF/FlaG flagellin family)
VEKVITTMLLMIAGIVATAFVINAVLPAVQRASTDIVAASDTVGNRMRSDVRIIEISGTGGSDEVQVWAKNVGAADIPALEKIDVFFGETDNFGRIAYDAEPTCVAPLVPPRTSSCWQYTLENDTRWTPFATLRISIYLDADLVAGQEYVATVVLPNGIRVSETFTV